MKLIKIPKRAYNLLLKDKILEIEKKEKWPWSSGRKYMDKSFEEWPKTSSTIQLATFYTGQYWRTEYNFANIFDQIFPGSIMATKVGFMCPEHNITSKSGSCVT